MQGHIKNKSPKIFCFCRRTTYTRGRCHPKPLPCMDLSGLNTFPILECKQSWVQSATRLQTEFDTEFIYRQCWSSVAERKIKVCQLVVVKIKSVTKQVKKNCWHCCRFQGSTGEGVCTGLMYFLRMYIVYLVDFLHLLVV